MYWHIDTDIVSLIVMVALFVYNMKVPLSEEYADRNKRFLRCMQSGIIITAIDIAASIVMEIPVSRFTYQLFMVLYLISIEFVIVEWFFYANTILFKDRKQIKRADILIFIPVALYALTVCSNPWTELFFSLGPNNEYSRGPLFFLMVVLYGVYCLALLTLIIVRRKHIPPNYPGVVLLLIPIVITVSIIVQLAVPGLLLVMPGFMVCLVLTFLFLQTRRAKENQVLVQQLSGAALADQLTGLYNRNGMAQHVGRALERDAGKPCLVAVIDLDDLKYINDTLGHPEGDIAIKLVAEQLKKHFRSSDAVARFGGDEFVVFLTGELNEVQALRSLKLLVWNISTLAVGEGDDTIPLSTSVGACMGVVGEDDFDELCHKADVALYHVKRGGKNGCVMYNASMEREEPQHDADLRLPVS